MEEQQKPSEDTVPFFSMRISPVSGVEVKTNMPKHVLVFELQKLILAQMMNSWPGEGLLPPPAAPPGQRVGRIIPAG
jgi:hypothetical protein